MDLDLAADIWRPDVMRWLGFALGGHEKQNIAVKLLWQERPHETNAVLVAIDDSLIVMVLEYGMEMSILTQGVHHRPYRIGHPREKNLFFVFFMATAQRLLAIARIAVEKGEQCDPWTGGEWQLREPLNRQRTNRADCKVRPAEPRE